MSGRRGHQRFAIASPAAGAIRVLRDVVIDRMDRDDVVAISQTPGIIGEEMSLDLISSSGCVALRVKVLESRPVVVAGSLRHQLRLVVTTVGSAAQPATAESRSDEAGSASEVA